MKRFYGVRDMLTAVEELLMYSFDDTHLSLVVPDSDKGANDKGALCRTLRGGFNDLQSLAGSVLARA